MGIFHRQNLSCVLRRKEGVLNSKMRSTNMCFKRIKVWLWC